ncbi:MAG: endonuclease/exonuclease/phosphatase family protein [Oceanobacter sp.]
MPYFYPLFASLSALVVFATLLPLWKHPHWIVRGLDFPRLQILVLGLLVLVAELLALPMAYWQSQILVIPLMLCLIWQARLILPYTRVWRTEVKNTGSMPISADGNIASISVLNANVLMTNHNAKPLMTLVERLQPDILVTLESDLWWQQHLDKLSNRMPYQIPCPLDNLYGMHVYSRLPLEDASIDFRVQDGIPSMHAWARLENGERVEIYFLHPAPPSPTENEESTERDQELIQVARMIRERPSNWPVLVTGDLNDTAWSATTRLFRKISGLLDPRIGRGPFNTFHADFRLLRWPLDHLFHSEHFTLSDIQRGPHIGSDHFPLYAKLQLNSQPVKGQDGIEATEEEKEWAEQLARGER